MKKLMKFTILLCSILTTNFFAQTSNIQPDNSAMASFIKRVSENSTKNTKTFFEEYQHSFRTTIGSENKKSQWVYEQYCLNGKPFCENVLIEKNGEPIKSSKIEKAREKAGERLAKKEATEKAVSSGAGISLGQTVFNPINYLSYCSIKQTSEKIIDGRATISLEVNDCNIDNVPADYKKRISFIPGTKAEILIDKQDETVIELAAYPKNQSSVNQNNPVIILRSERMPNGDWLFKQLRVEAFGNKTIFPNLDDNLQLDFFDFKPLSVEVKEQKPTAN